MGRIETVEVRSYTEYSTASYIDDDGEEYEIVIEKTYHHNIGYEEQEVVNVERGGVAIAGGDPIWGKIKTCLRKGGD